MAVATAAWHPTSHINTHPGFPEVVGAKGSRLILADGREVIDAISSWWVTLHGHCEPVIAEAIAKQAATLDQVIFASFTHEPAEELCELLGSILPGQLNHPFFSDNGSTAVEVALKMAHQYWKNIGQPKAKFLAFEGGYHGDTLGAMSVGERGIFSEGVEELLFSVKRAPYPQTEAQESTALESVRRALEGGDIAAVIIEPLFQGAAGMRMCRPEFLRALSALVKEHRSLLIYDEVATGWGRTGELFACIKAGTEPDLICLSKGITGGFLPLAVTVASSSVFEAFMTDNPSHTFWHGHSYTANPIACAAALASTKLLIEQESFRKLEEWHLEELQAFEGKVINPRVCGTVAAFDLPGEEGYLAEQGWEIRDRALKEGVFIRPMGNVVYLLPPYCITREELAYVYGRLYLS